MADLKTVPGEWYFGVLCKTCDAEIMVFRDLSKGKKKLTLMGAGKLLKWCPMGHEHLYSADELQSREVAIDQLAARKRDPRLWHLMSL